MQAHACTYTISTPTSLCTYVCLKLHHLPHAETCTHTRTYIPTYVCTYVHVIICVVSPLWLLLQKQGVTGGTSAKLHSHKFLSLLKTAHPQKEPQVCGGEGRVQNCVWVWCGLVSEYCTLRRTVATLTLIWHIMLYFLPADRGGIVEDKKPDYMHHSICVLTEPIKAILFISVYVRTMCVCCLLPHVPPSSLPLPP